MEKIKRLVLEHKFALILAIFLALVTIFPQVYFRIEHRNDGIYKGIELLPDSPWSARAREVMDGHPNFGAIYYKDGKDLPYLFQPLGSMVAGYMGKVLGLEINNTLLVSKIVFSISTFLLIYIFVLLLSRQKLISLAAASVLTFADSALSFYGISKLLNFQSPDSFLRLARPINPAMIYILLFSFLILFFIYYQKRNWKFGLASAVVLAANFYNYFYTWTYLYAFGGFIVLFLLLQRKWRDAVQISAVFVGALLLGIPYLTNLFKATQHPEYLDASLRAGVIASHGPLFVGVAVFVSLAVFVFGFPKREQRTEYFFGLALLVTPFVTMNQQILTGKIMQADHYHWFFHKPIGLIFVLITVSCLISKWKFDRYKKWFIVLVILASVAVGIFVQTYSYYWDRNDGGVIAIERQNYGPVMDWLNANAVPESVVLANDEISHITVIYTPLNLFYHRAAGYSLAATRERLTEVVLTLYRLRGITTQDARKVFFEERANISTMIDVMHYRKLYGYYELIPDTEVEKVLKQYEETLKTPTSQWLQKILMKYEVEHVVWDKKHDPSWNLDRYPFLKKVAEFGDVAIYSTQ